MLKRHLQSGDTIIEVLIAVTVFSLVAVGSLTIMNRATNTAQQAIEITLVRQQVDAQVEALRAAHQAYSRFTTDAARDNSVWKSLKATSINTIPANASCPSDDALRNNQAFIMNPQQATIMTADEGAVLSMNDQNAPVFPQVINDKATGKLAGYGLWIERHPVSGGFTPAAYDFRVRACWYGSGTGDTPMALETTVRLYDVE